jgi:hypothetical protein
VAEKKAIRRRASAEREKELVRSALLLRRRSAVETLETMFELVEFAEEINQVVNET